MIAPGVGLSSTPPNQPEQKRGDRIATLPDTQLHRLYTLSHPLRECARTQPSASVSRRHNGLLQLPSAPATRYSPMIWDKTPHTVICTSPSTECSSKRLSGEDKRSQNQAAPSQKPLHRDSTLVAASRTMIAPAAARPRRPKAPPPARTQSLSLQPPPLRTTRILHSDCALACSRSTPDRAVRYTPHRFHRPHSRHLYVSSLASASTRVISDDPHMRATTSAHL